MEDKLDTLPSRVKWAREAHGMPSANLSILAKLSQSHVGQIERGTITKLDLETTVKLAKVFGVSLDWLVNGSGRRPSKAAIRSAIDSAKAAQPVSIDEPAAETR